MEEKNIRLLDTQFARFLAKRSLLSGKEKQSFQELVCRLSVSLATGDSCLPLQAVEQDIIQRSGLSGEGLYPLTVFDNCLYLQRLFQYEKRLADKISQMASDSHTLTADRDFVQSLFGETSATDMQYVAAMQALKKNFLIISGGPGTGKTTTVVKILALLRNGSEKKLQIALAAPTGKAANRLQESLRGKVEDFPVQASTLHRLLGVRRHSPFFRHNAENPLACDVLVVDEASMVDLALMSKLVTALRPGSRLILLGDKNQLSSVESGTVLADIMEALPENSVELQKSYRFDADIKGFAEAINKGDHKKAWLLITADKPEHISLLQEEVAIYAGEKYNSYMQMVSRAKNKADYLRLFSVLKSFKILCVVRKGSRGVYVINRRVEHLLAENGYDCLQSEWYSGRPVMVTRNEYSLNLYNGDMGICLADPESPESVKVWFQRPDGSLRGILPGRLSSCETAYALTIHKSQGAEFADVLVVLPEKASARMSRELLYTAVTRASRSIVIKSDNAVFRRTVNGEVRRNSGLARFLVDHSCKGK